MQPKEPRKGKNQGLVMVGAGFEFVTNIVLFVLSGYYLDEYLESAPWFLLSGFFLGFFFSFYLLIKKANSLNQED